MRAVLRLTWTFFAATPLTRRLAVLGLVCITIGAAGHVLTPGYMRASASPDVPWHQILILMISWLGLLFLVASTILMPAIVERIACGRATWLLPFGRVRLLISATLPAILLATLTAIGSTYAIREFNLEPSYGRIFYRTFVMAFVDFGLIYTAIWLVGKTSGVWRLAGTLWIVISITIPLRYIGGIPPFSLLEGLGLASWVVFGFLILSGARTRLTFQGVRGQVKALVSRLLPAVDYVTGREVELQLGTTRPWVVAIGQVIPIGFMVWFVPFGEIWIVFFVTFSAIAGAMTSQAAGRSRRLWLKYDWTREQIRSRVEHAYWRFNACSLGILLLVYFALANYAGLGLATQALSLALIALGCIVCTYLGLMITRGLGWFESALAVLTMITIVLAAFAIMQHSFATAIELEALLVGLAIVYRLTARSRWLALDWMQCRFERPVRSASQAG